MALSDIKNFVQLTESIATSGQPTAPQFTEIAAAGYTAVINLALAESDHAIANEGAIIAGAGMIYIHLPVKFDGPTMDELRTFAGFMDTFGDAMVWVHCVANLRVSAFLYPYLKHVRGLDETQARSPMIDKWASRMDETWTNFLAEGDALLRPPA